MLRKIDSDIAGTFSELAEKEILYYILDLPKFSPPQIKIRLASYPSCDSNEKSERICELMDYFWAKGKFASIFPIFQKFEAFMKVIGRRGNFVHQFEVFLLGLIIIKYLVNINKRNSSFNYLIFKDFDKIFYTWLISSTAHDIGYPLEVATSIAAKLSELYKEMNLETLSQNYHNLENQNTINAEDSLFILRMPSNKNVIGKHVKIDEILIKSIEKTLHISYSESRDLITKLKKENNHGYISAAILCNIMLSHFLKIRNFEILEKKWEYGSLKLALGAIALHALKNDLTKYIAKVEFDSNPYAFILILFDNIQDWSRPSVINSEWPIYNLSNFIISDKIITIKYDLKLAQWEKKIVRKVEKSIIDKIKVLEMLIKPRIPIGITINVSFTVNSEFSFPEIKYSF